MKYVKIICLVSFAFLFFSCSTLRGFRNPVCEGNFYGMIIDEKNQPVRDFKLTCEDERKTLQTAITNSSGFFVMENVSTGQLLLSGTKIGFVEIKNEQIDFLGTDKVFCWQINSTEGVLETVERLILLGEYKQALSCIKELKLENNSEEQKLVKELEKQLRRKMREKGEKENDEEFEV